MNENQVFELAKAASDVGGIQDGVLVLFLAYTGLRIGEATALQVGDVNFATNRIIVNKTWTVGGDTSRRVLSDTTKTGKDRKVPIPYILKEPLKMLCEGYRPENWLFRASRSPYRQSQRKSSGAIMACNWRTRVWKKAKIAAGLDNVPNLTVHSLRHTTASLAIKAGADVKIVQALLGHSDASITLNTYAGLFPDSLDEITNKMGKSLLERRLPFELDNVLQSSNGLVANR